MANSRPGFSRPSPAAIPMELAGSGAAPSFLGLPPLLVLPPPSSLTLGSLSASCPIVISDSESDSESEGSAATGVLIARGFPSLPDPCSNFSGLPLLVRARTLIEALKASQNHQGMNIARFNGISEAVYNETIYAITSLFHNEFGGRVRIDYFGSLYKLVVRIPTAHHEFLANKSVSIFRRALYCQGFYWKSWPPGIDYIKDISGSDRSVENSNRPNSKFQPDAGLEIPGSRYPFLIVEVVDLHKYPEVMLKAKQFLLRTDGVVRFVVIITLAKKTRKVKEGLAAGSPVEQSRLVKVGQLPLAAEKSENASPRTGSGEDQAYNATPPSGPAEIPILPKKRYSPYISSLPAAKRPCIAPAPRTSSVMVPDSPPKGSSLPAPDGYDIATATVFTTTNPSLTPGAGKHKRRLVRLLSMTEFWPIAPAAGLSFKFSWDDMEMERYPQELKGCVFTIDLMRLHTMLNLHFTPPTDPTTVPVVVLDSTDQESHDRDEDVQCVGYRKLKKPEL